MFGAIQTAVSGLQASAKRVQASASNIANARDSIRMSDARIDPVQAPPPANGNGGGSVYEPVTVQQESVEGGGTRASYVPINPPHVAVYAPDDPKANADGMVARPNVDYATEMVNMMQAKTAYSANVKTIQTENEMIGALLDKET